jgi:aminoglycoside 6'-N-acetyltransferase I
MNNKDILDIKKATKEDALILAGLAIQMWHSHSISELQAKFEDLIYNVNAVCFIKYVNNKAIGFVQCQLRNDYVEGTSTSPVGYLEGIFIQEEYRHSGYAKELLLECEKWVKEKHCTEFASDCELDNDISLEFHLSMGFKEANRIICFRKDI